MGAESCACVMPAWQDHNKALPIMAADREPVLGLHNQHAPWFRTYSMVGERTTQMIRANAAYLRIKITTDILQFPGESEE
jgi:hypothetical protein